MREAYRKKGWAFSTPQTIEQCVAEGWTDKMKEQLNEGCNVKGYLEVSKVAGNFHFAPGKSFQQHSVHGMTGNSSDGGDRPLLFLPHDSPRPPGIWDQEGEMVRALIVHSLSVCTSFFLSVQLLTHHPSSVLWGGLPWDCEPA